MNRRFFIQSVVGSGVTMLGGIAAFEWYQQATLDYSQDPLKDEKLVTQFLTADDRLILTVFIPVIVGHLKVPADISVSIINIDNAIIRLPLRTQKELRDLLDLLAMGIGRLILAGVWLNWQKAGSQDVFDFLADWRDSQLTLLQTAYIGLHKLIIGSVYAESEHWSAIGYPGPLKLF